MSFPELRNSTSGWSESLGALVPGVKMTQILKATMEKSGDLASSLGGTMTIGAFSSMMYRNSCDLDVSQF